MGSLRNPVGPLPSTIYWRRRAVLLSVVALLALLIVWVVGFGGGGGNKNSSDGSNGKNPAPTITPGPSGSGPAISQRPGGRDESGGSDSGGGSGSGSGSGSEGGNGTGEGSGSESGSGDSAGSASNGGSGDGSNGGGGAGEQLPAGSALPNCTANAVKLALKSLRNTYAPGEKPRLELTAKNSSGSDCKLDLGPKNTVLTITQAGDDTDIWSSDDCPKTPGSVLFRVPADDQVTYTVEWDRKAGVPECARPPAGSAPAGTYLVEAKAPGLTKAQTSFVLSKD
ncbi:MULTISPECIES: hypothetical protein [Streptomyces]|uniref:DUF4232 domain-containing protein n=1 Tax=Streptomyces dengpaensis TaxID=2049881 RepID=A0ABM6SRM1_9ACTN|nr:MULTISPECIES: hypothetical protein [Streptomyces]AVH57287.1 hypothetical protein C4B68_17590 [Streptomyces dengpaensis]PIB03663.1 hypothetical protein B1C81_36340 [Streptomyces sp. HG99]